MTAQIQVELIGANGSRTTQVRAAGFTTRHVQTPRELVPSIFGDVKLSDRKAAPKPMPQAAPVSTPEAPKQTLSELLAEVDDLLNPPARVNTAPGHHGPHYTEAKPPIDYDSPLRAWWRRVEQRTSDNRMAYLRSQKQEVSA